MIKKKIPVVSIVLYALAVILALFTIWSIVNVHAYIAQQQVPFSGNEYNIINYYMGNSGQYVMYAIVFFSLGWILQKLSPVTESVTSELDSLSTFGFETDMVDSEEVESEELDSEAETTEEDTEKDSTVL